MNQGSTDCYFLKRIFDYLDSIVLSGDPRSRGKALTGKDGELEVVHIDQETDYFETFI